MEFNVIVTDKNNKVIAKEELQHKVIDCDSYYATKALVKKRIENEYNFDKVH